MYQGSARAGHRTFKGEARETAAAWRILASGLAGIPLAGLLGRATDDLTETMGPGLGGFLNGSLGNAAELIIGLVAIREGAVMYPLVKASITGSIVGNVLSVLGKVATTGKVNTRRDALIMLALATGGIAYVSEIFVGSSHNAATSFGMNPVFIGVFVVAVVGNAAEHSSSVLMAIKNKLDVSPPASSSIPRIPWISTSLCWRVYRLSFPC